jgi:hypothetical protein
VCGHRRPAQSLRAPCIRRLIATFDILEKEGLCLPERALPIGFDWECEAIPSYTYRLAGR